MSKLTLYGFLLCPYAQRTRFALEALKIDYDYQHIDLYTNAQRSESYLKINPFGKVPTVKINDEIIYESLTLLEFFADQFGNVLPKDNVARAQHRIWANYFDQNVISKLWPVIGFLKTNNEEGIQKQAKEMLENIQFFTKHSGLEEQIKKNPKSYFSGDKLSYVDFAIIPHIRSIDTFFRLFVKKSIFDFAEKSQLIDAFQTYFKNGTTSEPYLAITDKLKQLPPIETNALLKELDVHTLEQFNYEQYYKEYHQRKFLN